MYSSDSANSEFGLDDKQLLGLQILLTIAHLLKHQSGVSGGSGTLVQAFISSHVQCDAVLKI